MSHIVKGKVDIAYADREILHKALASMGTVHENERASIISSPGVFEYTQERYPIVLEASTDSRFRMGFKQDAQGRFAPYLDEYGELGAWCASALETLKDRYIAYHYQRQLESEGFKVDVRPMSDGSLEVVAEEAGW